MPRVHCKARTRSVAAGPVAGSPSKGWLWRYDPPDRRAQFGDTLVSCSGSLAIVDLPVPGQQLEFGTAGATEDTGGIDTLPLF
ncbi:hypothetical protein GCM10010503_52310 [Streptomyces lucensis JCM 4490]|uniref:Uncharacterized protein n=2 Tax=Streptomyces lucensis TaxID=67319 RepID=A0A918JDZ0_9ACTN|nr:hypothetical protein GCM10010503_52310 [Streptomyces lucensis JCM 4490]